MPYVTDNELELAYSLDYKHTRRTQYGDKFERGHRHVWSTQYGWKTADLINGCYCNHKMFKYVGDALKRPDKQED